MQKIYRIANLPSSSTAFASLPIVRGYIDAMRTLPDGNIQVLGWLLLPDTHLDQVDVYLDGIRVLSATLAERPDVGDVFSWIPHASTSGLNFVLPLIDKQPAATSMLEIVALHRHTPVGRLSHLVRADIDTFSFPLEDLSFRVAHTRDPHFFKLSGLKVFGEFIEAARRHSDLSTMKRILDWGCGCGRVTAHLMCVEDWEEVLGCDIDAQAIQWCNMNLHQGAFAILDPYPPAPYPDAHFDMILSYSVFTHLERHVQRAWLQEMYRLLSPSGLFLATTHGDFAFSFAKARLNPKFPMAGIEDSSVDTTLGGVAPKNYYRGTYQSKAYTIREFGRYFQVLEYVERGATNFQDLIVFRKQ